MVNLTKNTVNALKMKKGDSMSEVLEAEVNKPDAVRELELFCELRKLKTFLKPIAKNGRFHIGKNGGYDYFHINDILETIDTVINEHGINIAIWQEIKYEMVSQTKINYIETMFIHTKNGYKHIIKTDLNMSETIEVYKLDMQYRSEYANVTKTERRQANNTIQQIMGSSFTYFCRYVLVKFFGITELLEDDDGNAGGNHTSRVVAGVQQASGQTQASNHKTYNYSKGNNGNNNGNNSNKRDLDTPEDRQKLYNALDKLANREGASKLKFYVKNKLISVGSGWYYAKGFKDKIEERITNFSKLEHKFKDKIEEIKRNHEREKVMQEEADKFMEEAHRIMDSDDEDLDGGDNYPYSYSSIRFGDELDNNYGVDRVS
ncbi:ERF family protein [Borrelia sp. RT1S]|uniref:ERF family protein n=1 Tax=Borrelia sp. RT1S TaxID=2898580 RepID=UPI001E302E74|nr:ERF family protein [Borrelia sp. RT1S]UGQ17900.1 ERF family protein [Borrelia sp. RT1S]